MRAFSLTDSLARRCDAVDIARRSRLAEMVLDRAGTRLLPFVVGCGVGEVAEETPKDVIAVVVLPGDSGVLKSVSMSMMVRWTSVICCSSGRLLTVVPFGASWARGAPANAVGAALLAGVISFESCCRL